MTLKQPTLFFRALVLGAQGVFFNIFCTYASWPHGFVSRTAQSPRLYDLPPIVSQIRGTP